jgi:5-hydroxyisourate hydrolase-like protein (transthyretin family)
VEEVKIAASAAFFLLLACYAQAICPVGIAEAPPIYQPSTRNIRITVLRDGEPAKAVLVEVHRAGMTGTDQPPLLFATTTEDGFAALSDLPKGKYVIDAIATDRARTHLLLKVSKNKARDEDTTNFQMFLELPQEHVAWRPWNQSVGPLGRHFEGLLTDPIGTAIAAVKIQIFRKGTGTSKDVIQLQSDERGRFSAQLEDGTYLAIFRVFGFRLEIVPFEVVAQGEKDVLIKMQIAASC